MFINPKEMVQKSESNRQKPQYTLDVIRNSSEQSMFRKL